MSYDYKAGKKRVLEILNDTNEIREVKRIPSSDALTYNNGYYGWVTSIFVDIRKSTELFAENRKASTARIIRSFSSEIIEILKAADNLIEIGIRGDCVYGVYSAPDSKDLLDLLRKAFLIETFILMLNRLLANKQMKRLKVGIGLSASQDLVVKAGRRRSEYYGNVWIGRAVTYASKLSDVANTNAYPKRILMTSRFYNRISDQFKSIKPGFSAKEFFTECSVPSIGTVYGCNCIESEFRRWVIGGMKDG